VALGDMVSVCAGRGLGSGLMIRGVFSGLSGSAILCGALHPCSGLCRRQETLLTVSCGKKMSFLWCRWLKGSQSLCGSLSRICLGTSRSDGVRCQRADPKPPSVERLGSGWAGQPSAGSRVRAEPSRAEPSGTEPSPATPASRGEGGDRASVGLTRRCPSGAARGQRSSAAAAAITAPGPGGSGAERPTAAGSAGGGSDGCEPT